MPGKGKGKSPMKTIMRGQNKQLSSLSNIGQVLQQQQEALAQIQASPQNGDKSSQVANIQVINSLNRIASLIQSNNNQTKKLVQNTNKQIDAIWKSNKDWKSVGDRFKDFSRNIKDKFSPDSIKKSLLGNFTMFKGARDKIEDINYKKSMRAQGDTRSNKELDAAAKDSRNKKVALLRLEDEYRKMKTAGASDKDIARNRPDLIKKRQQALKDYQESRDINPEEKKKKKSPSKPETPKGNFTGDQPSAPLKHKGGPSTNAIPLKLIGTQSTPLNRNTPKGNFTGDQPSAPLNKNTPKGNFTGDQPSAKLTELPSDKGALAQSTTDKLADAQSQHEMEVERTKMIGMQTDLLSQIAANTAAMSGRKSSSAGGAEDSGTSGGGMLGALGSGISMLGGGIGKGAAGLGRGLGAGIKGLSAGIGALGDGLAKLGKGLGQGLIGLLQGLAAGMAALANPATLIGLGAFTLAAIGIGKALELAAPAIEAITPLLQTLVTTIGDVFMKAIDKLPETLKSVGTVIQAIGDGIVGTIKAIADGIVSVIDAIGRLFGRNSSDSKAGKDQGKAIAGQMVTAIKDGAKGGSDAQKDKNTQDNGFYTDKDGNLHIVDQQKYNNYLKEQGMKPSGTGGKSADQMTDARTRSTVAVAGNNGTMNLNAPATLTESELAKQQALLRAGKSSGGSTTVVQQNNNNSQTVTPSWNGPRNQESSVARYMARRYQSEM